VSDLVLRSRRVALPGGLRPATVHVRAGVIAAITDDQPPGTVELGDRMLLPGLVDTHVHVNEPGRTDWEGFATATRAAAAGGVTTLVDMPLNSIPATTTVAALERKRAAAAGRCAVDVAFWGGVVPGNTAELGPLWAAGVAGFKCFMVPSGVDEFGHVGEAELREAMPVLARLGAPLLAHAELPGPIQAAAPGLAGRDPRDYATYLASRPDAAEVEAVELLVRLAREHGTRVHIVHVASARVLPLLRAARREGLPITAETCPHYLHFAAEDIPDGGTDHKCAPPIRDAATREALWSALGDGTLDLVATDHSPCPPEMKGLAAGDFFAAWGGIASLQLGLAAAWTGGRARGFAPESMARWMAAAPARLAGLGRKGAIEVGRDADLVVWDPEGETRVDPERLEHRHPLTPYAHATLSGRVLSTYVRGTLIHDRGRCVDASAGRLLIRGGS
jgi:allantoinase